jgi:hypothetical protein
MIAPSSGRGIFKEGKMEKLNLLDLTRSLLDLKAEKKAFNTEIGVRIRGLEEDIKQMAKES